MGSLRCLSRLIIQRRQGRAAGSLSSTPAAHLGGLSGQVGDITFAQLPKDRDEIRSGFVAETGVLKNLGRDD